MLMNTLACAQTVTEGAEKGAENTEGNVAWTDEAILKNALPLHLAIDRTLSEQQRHLLNAAYPNYRLFAECIGPLKNEVVLGVWTVDDDKSDLTQGIRRIGLVLENGAWQLHDIDAEIQPLQPEQNPRRDLSFFPLAFEFNEQGISAEFICNPWRKGESRITDRDGKLIDLPPFFRLNKVTFANKNLTCFSIDFTFTYNVVDCVAYRKNERRFKIWYRQVFVD